MLTGIASNRDGLFLEGSDSSKVTVDVTVTKSLSPDFVNKLSRSYRSASTDFNVSVLG
jgi:hypothetical protein